AAEALDDGFSGRGRVPQQAARKLISGARRHAMTRSILPLRKLGLSLAFGLPAFLISLPSVAVESAGHVSGAGSLDQAIRSAGRAGAGWVAWEVPKVEHQGDVCCYEG